MEQERSITILYTIVILLLGCNEVENSKIYSSLYVHQSSINQLIAFDNGIISAGNDGKIFYSNAALTESNLLYDSGYDTIEDVLLIRTKTVIISSFNQGFKIVHLEEMNSDQIDFFSKIDSVIFSQNTNSVIFSSSGKLYSFEVSQKKIRNLSDELAVAIQAMHFLEKDLLALGTFSGQLLIYDLSKNKVVKKIDLGNGLSVMSIVHNKEKIFAVGQANGRIENFVVEVSQNSSQIRNISICQEAAYDIELVLNKLYVACGDVYIYHLDSIFGKTERISIPEKSATDILFIDPYLYVNGGSSGEYIGGNIYKISE
ncbi:hypothetical protein JWG40_19655 [Leptospira sp. 201903074]|uniref:WD40 domain-containing protein n=1 Tax=Leptospira abararensis TaxID=2810036 RepID=UPI0019641750|nr:hypothetical protein [Leptospira abararensis]MBM9549248.1 hypothetical protein [Leptospira abararensis]